MDTFDGKEILSVFITYLILEALVLTVLSILLFTFQYFFEKLLPSEDANELGGVMFIVQPNRSQNLGDEDIIHKETVEAEEL